MEPRAGLTTKAGYVPAVTTDYTCFATCAATCQSTCLYTCGTTCGSTCYGSSTCQGSYTCAVTTCGYTCAATCDDWTCATSGCDDDDPEPEPEPSLPSDPYVVGDTTYDPVYGADRFETAVAASGKGWTDSEYVLIATGRNWPDALGGAGLAGAHDAPILLSDTNDVPDCTLDEIARLSASKAIILGGTGAVGPDAEQELAAALGAANVTRIGGGDRYATAELIAQAIDAAGAQKQDTAFVATGGNFPDALAAAPLVAANRLPLFLVPPGGATPVSAIQDCGATKVYILGGTGVVSQAQEDELTAAFGAGSVVRLAGANRFATASSVAEEGCAQLGTTWDGLALATGTDFPDALTGGALQGGLGSVMLLTASTSLSPETSTTLAAHNADIANLTFLGGTGAISMAVRTSVENLLKD